GRRRRARADRRRAGPVGQARPQARRLRRARRRPGLDRPVRGAGPELRVLLALPRADRPLRRRAGGAGPPGVTSTASQGAAGLVRTLDELGGFFALSAPPPGGSDAVAWAEVVSGPALRARFDAVRTILADGAGVPAHELDPKVAVSAVQVGLASRLWSVALASAVLHSWLPDLSSASLLASPVHRGQVPLAVQDVGAGYAVASPEEASRR